MKPCPKCGKMALRVKRVSKDRAVAFCRICNLGIEAKTKHKAVLAWDKAEFQA